MARPDSDVIAKLQALRPELETDVLQALNDAVSAAIGDLPQPRGGPLTASRAETARRSRTPIEPDQATWKEFAHLGWLGLVVPEALGGSGGDLAAVGVVARGLGRAGRREQYTAAAVITPLWLMATSGDGGLADLLASVVDGSQLIVPAWQSRTGGLDIDHPGLPVLTRQARGYRLNGTCYWVPANGVAGYLVVARTSDCLGLAYVPADASGVATHPVAMSDGTSWGHVAFADVEVDRARLFALDPPHVEAVKRGLDAAVLTTAAELLGSVEGMLDLTIDYLSTRRQFGKVIGSHQVLQHKAVDMWLHRELLSAALADAYARLGGNDDSATLALLSSGTKARACHSAREVGNTAIQLHGAIGFTEEYPLSHLVNRSLVLSAWLGNRAYHLDRWGRSPQPGRTHRS